MHSMIDKAARKATDPRKQKQEVTVMEKGKREWQGEQWNLDTSWKAEHETM